MLSGWGRIDEPDEPSNLKEISRLLYCDSLNPTFQLNTVRTLSSIFLTVGTAYMWYLQGLHIQQSCYTEPIAASSPY